MTLDDIKQAQSLAAALGNFTDIEHKSFVDGYVKGRDSMRAERDAAHETMGIETMKWAHSFEQLVAERARSAKLIELAVKISALTETCNDQLGAWYDSKSIRPLIAVATRVVAEFEVSK